MRRQIALGIATVLGAGVVSIASAAQCSIHPAKGASDAQLAGLAKVPQADAEKQALTQVKGPATVADAELEAEHGCLIWSFDLRLTGKSGIQEVQIDAGNGKVLSVKHESAKQEAAEAAQEARDAKKP